MLKELAGRVARRLARRTFVRLEAVDRQQQELAGLAERCAGLERALASAEGRCARLEERADAAEHRLRGAEDVLGELRGRLDDVGDLRGRVGELDDGLDESRRLSLRVAQLTDLVFDRLAVAPGRPNG